MTKSECYLLAAQLGAVIHDDGNLVRLEAPRFKTVSIGVHEWHYDCDSGRTDLWRDLGKDLKQGFQDCDDHLNRDCEWCDEAEYK